MRDTQRDTIDYMLSLRGLPERQLENEDIAWATCDAEVARSLPSPATHAIWTIGHD